MRTLLRSFALMLPALVPSWRFFDVIAPSPRVHFRLLNDGALVQDWQEFNPRPAHVSILTILVRMLWSPHWNEQLFVMSCAERILAHYTPHSENEIAQRIARRLSVDQRRDAKQLQFKLLLVERVGPALTSRDAFTSRLLDFSETT